MRNRKNRILAIITAGVLAFMATHARANLILNPGFETGSLSPWSIGNDISSTELWNVTSSDSHTGTYSATARGNVELIQAFAPVAVSDIIQASMWLKMPGGAGAIAFISFHYSDLSSGGSTFTIGTDWAEYDATAFLQPGKFLTGFGVYGCSGCGGESRTFLDNALIDVRSEPVPSPATLALFCLGLSGLVWSRRKKV